MLRRISSALSVLDTLQSQAIAHQLNDTSQTERTLTPQSPTIKLWHQVLLGALCYEIFIVPFVITFKPHASLFTTAEVIIFYSLELLFLLDFAVKLNTLQVKDGNIQDLAASRVSYLRSAEFALDFVTILPFSAIPISISVSPMFLELTKVLRVARLPGYLANLDNVYAKHFELLKLFKILVGVVLLSHLVACVRFTFGYNDEHSDHVDHWLPTASGHGHSALTQYLMSLFWAFGLLTGLFEGELPHTSKEFVFTIFVAICGFSMFTYLCATFFMLSKCESSQSEANEARIRQIKQVFEFHQVPSTLQHKVVDYLENYYADAGSNDRQVMEMLCQSIGRDIQVELVKDVFARVPLFASCREEFIIALTRLLERVSLPAQMTLFAAGDFGDAMYVIHTGVLDILSSTNHEKIRELRKHDFVGELSLFSNQPRSATVVCATFCVLYKLSRRHTEIVLKGYPDATSIIANNVHTLLNSSPGAKTHGQSPPRQFTDRRRNSLFSSSSSLRRQSGSITEFVLHHGSVSAAPATLPAGGTAERRNEETTKTNQQRAGKVVAEHRDTTETQRRKGSETLRSEALQFFYMKHLTENANSLKRTWWSNLLLKTCIDADSPRRLWWIACLQVVLIYNWFQISLNLAFPLFVHSAWYIPVLNVVTDVVLWVDIYLNFNYSYKSNSETIWNTMRSARRYFRGAFLMDLLTAIPYCGFSDTSLAYAGRIPRLFRIWRSVGHFREVNKLHPLRSKQRLMLYGVLLLLLSHLLACLYFCITFTAGFSTEEDSWIPSNDVELRAIGDSTYMDCNNATYSADDPEVKRIAYTQYFRSLYYSTNVLTALGRTIEPETDVEFAMALCFMFSGFFITAIVVDNVQKRFTASAHEEKDFFATRARIQLFLRRQNAPFAIHKRVNSFLDYWWESHRGAKIEDLFQNLPTEHRREVLLQLCKPALQTLSLLNGVRPYLDALEVALVDCAEFILYGHGEKIYLQGEHARGLFFLLQGSVVLHAVNTQPREVMRGGCFGIRSVCLASAATGYAATAVAECGCATIFISQAKLTKLQEVFPSFGSTLVDLEKRLFQSKLSKRVDTRRRSITGTAVSIPVHSSSTVRIIDPDSKRILVWELWLFAMMTYQWFRIIIMICFGVSEDEYVHADSVTVGVEVSFFVDIFVRTRLGYRHFGNKEMNPKRIKQRYLHSWHFAVDVIALLPLYAINWVAPSFRLELVNLNKLIRLAKVPHQLSALEQRFVKFANELRLFKLVYYTVVASHLLGSLYFDFASHASSIYSIAAGVEHATNFGGNKWLPPSRLANASQAEQYFASQFWAFGLMSASTQAELPKTSMQCIFTITTLTTGFFLFAYVVGNLTDIIELADAENRGINEKLQWTRRLLAHFTLPQSLAVKLKAYFLFKRYHSITQERILEQSLPPSLMTDIRLLNLRPMIEKVPFLGQMDSSITRMLVSQLTQVLILKGEYVFRYGDPGSDMYFVFSGVLTILASSAHGQANAQHTHKLSCSIMTGDTDEQTTLVVVDELKSGDFFGENALFSNARRTSYVRCKASSILYILSKRSLEMLFELFPDWKKSVEQMVKIQQKKQRAIPTKSKPVHGDHDGSPGHIHAALQTVPNRQSDANHWFGVAAVVACWHNLVDAARNGVDLQSRGYIAWIRIVMFATMYIAIFVPYCIAFESCARWSGPSMILEILEVVCFIVFALDIWIQWKLKQSDQSIEYCEGDVTKQYKRERLVWDILAAAPIEYVFFTLASQTVSGWLRFNRCLKIMNLPHYMRELDQTSGSFESARLKQICSGYLLMIHWVACIYLLFAEYTGYGDEWQAWLPTEELSLDHTSASVNVLRYLRGLFFAVTAFVKKCRTFTPESMSADILAILTWFAGLLVMAFMIGEIASLYISLIGHEVDYRKNYIATERSLEEWKLSEQLKSRVHAFLSTLWASHRGMNYQAVLDEWPSNLRQETIVNIGFSALNDFGSKIIQPLAMGNATSYSSLIRLLADEMGFESYPPGEHVLTEGTIPTGIFFVVEGQLVATIRRSRRTLPLTRYKSGTYFGHLGILSCTLSKISVRTLAPCDLLSLSLDSFQSFLQRHPLFQTIQSVITQLVSDLKETNNGVLPTLRNVWGCHLRDILNSHRVKLAMSFADSADTGSEHSDSDWYTYLTYMMDRETPEVECMRVFEPLIEMMVPHGELVLENDKDKADAARTETTTASMNPRVLTLSRSLRALHVPNRVHVAGGNHPNGGGPSAAWARLRRAMPAKTTTRVVPVAVRSPTPSKIFSRAARSPPDASG